MLTQAIVDGFLRCPNCCGKDTLKYKLEKLICDNCGFQAVVRFDIPALVKKEDTGTGSYNFLGIPENERKIASPYKRKNQNKLIHFLYQETMHLCNAVFFARKFGLKRLLSQTTYCREVEKALYYGWKDYFNLLLKANEILQFNRMKKYISGPSLEIGCGGCKTTNMIFRDNIETITFGCEYFMDNFLDETGKLNDEMYKVIEHYVGGGIDPLPFSTSAFNSVIMVHIIDHIVHLEQMFGEINRVLKPGGHLVMTGYAKNVFDHLPGVEFRRQFSKSWAERYKRRKTREDNPAGCPMISDFEYDAVGQNTFSLSQWREIAKSYGFAVVDFAFFGKYFSYFMDIKCRGIGNSLFFNQFLYSAISRIIEEEKVRPLAEEEATNIILVLRKNV